MRIITAPNEILNRVAAPVEEYEDLTPLISEMKRTILKFGALGLAAPQVGVSKRLFIMRPTTLFLVCINPIIKSFGTENKTMPEGCLSIPGRRFDVTRPHSILVEYSIPHKNYMLSHKIIRQFDGLTARIFQHEYDHLNGKLIDDNL